MMRTDVIAERRLAELRALMLASFMARCPGDYNSPCWKQYLEESKLKVEALIQVAGAGVVP